ncbi:uncharacterized protein LOC143922790 [Arctopsyche grandis]|uniref:uncharacterized protein LOC143922790 n=1 Tax=Arctopsyche grandis TaxID=121162 RepID=UPI00406D7AC0
MKPISFQNIRRLMGGGRKKNEKDTSFKRSDSFKRISIRKNYLDRGGKKKAKAEANNILFKEESKLEEYNITPTSKPKSEKDKVENIYMKAPQSSKPLDDCDSFSERSSVVKVSSDVREAQLLRFTSSRDVCTQTDESKEPDTISNTPSESDESVKAPRQTEPIPKAAIPEKIIIHVPASEDMPKDPVVKPPVHKNLSNDELPIKQSETNLKRQESNDSAVEMFPWGESIEILKLDRSPVFPYRRNFSHPPSLLPEVSDDMCSLSVSLGRIWMDAPLAMSPRSLELPQRSPQASPAADIRTAHNSLDSALKSNKDDPIVVNRLQKNKPRKVSSTTDHVTRTSSSSTRCSDTKTFSSNDYPYMFSSKDSGFSFSLSIPKLNERDESKKGFFKTKPKLSAKDEYLRRSGGWLDSKFNPVFRTSSRSYKEFRSSIKMRKRTKRDQVKNDIYTVVVRRPPRSSGAMKLDPMMFVPPEDRDFSIRELREYSLPVDERTSVADYDSEDDFYERISPDFYETLLHEGGDSSLSSCDDSTISAGTGVSKPASLYVKNRTGRKPHFSGRRRRSSYACKTRVIYLKNSDFFDDKSEYVDVEEEDSSREDNETSEDVRKKDGRVRQVVRRRRSRARRFVQQTTCKYSKLTHVAIYTINTWSLLLFFPMHIK